MEAFLTLIVSVALFITIALVAIFYLKDNLARHNTIDLYAKFGIMCLIDVVILFFGLWAFFAL